MSTHVMTGTTAYDIASGERVAAVMASKSEVCHKWAAGRQDHARFRAIYFSGARLYSYGSHYVIGLVAEPGVVLLNSERTSMTTNGHVSEASSATSHMTQYWIPDLTRALKILDNLTSWRSQAKRAKREGMDSAESDSWLESCQRRAKSAKAELRGFVLENWRGFEPDQGAAAYLLGLAGFPGRATWHAIKAEGAKLEAKAKREREARDKARALADAKKFGDCSQAELARFYPADSYETRQPDSLADGYGEHAQKSFAKRLAAAHKASKAAGYTTRTRKLWARLKAFREYAAGRPARERAAFVAEKRAAFVAWRDHGAAKPPLWHYSGRALAEERAALEAAYLAEREAAALADYESWRETPTAVRRPDSRRFAEGSTPRLVLEGFEREEAEAAAKALEAWRASRGGRAPSAKPDSALFGQGGFVSRYPDLVERLGGNPWRELIYGTTREEEESRLAALEAAERLRQADIATKLEAWRNGASASDIGHARLEAPEGGAALRIAGDILETSQGARVPLAEAVAAFRFVKLLRQRKPAALEGEEPGVVWKANGRQVRVGSYALTRVYADGSFVAGCHSIRWPEIERAAIAAGVFEAEPSDAAEVTSSAAH